MNRLIDAIIRKWFCCHEWELVEKRLVEERDEFGDSSFYE